MGRNILVVEDDHNISDLIHMYLVKEASTSALPETAEKPSRNFKRKCRT